MPSTTSRCSSGSLLWAALTIALLGLSVATAGAQVGKLSYLPEAGKTSLQRMVITVETPEPFAYLRNVTRDCGALEWEYPIEHVQAIAMLRDHGDGMSRWVITGSRGKDGWIALAEVEGAVVERKATGRIVWAEVFDPQHAAGAYNHPGDIQIVGDTLVVALQNWKGREGICPLEMHDGVPSDGLGFYDLSSPRAPKYLGKLTAEDLFGKRREVDSVALFMVAPDRYVFQTVDGAFFASTQPSPRIADWQRIEVEGAPHTGSGGVQGPNGSYLSAAVHLEGETPTLTFSTVRLDGSVLHAEPLAVPPFGFSTTSFPNCGWAVHPMFGIGTEVKTLGPFVSADAKGRPLISCVSNKGGPFHIEALLVEQGG